MWRVADAGAAKRSGAVPGWTSTASSRASSRTEERVVEVTGKPARLIGAEQIGAADGSDEQRIAGEDASGSIGFAHEQRDVLGRVPGRVQYVDCDVPDAQRSRRASLRETGSGGAAPGPATTRAPSGRELACAGDEVGVNVRLDRKRERQPVSRRYRGVRVDVAPGVDDRWPCVCARRR